MVKEVIRKSWGSRIISAFWGILIGIALIIGSFVLVFWNEGHGLHTAQSLKQAQDVLISVPISQVDPHNNLRVVYFSGLAVTENILQDKYFGISEKAIQLDRKVEMCQWKEITETKNELQTGGSQQEVKTYTYEKTWSGSLINSSGFKEQANHKNPTEMPIESKRQYADQVNVGAFLLPHDLVTQIKGSLSIDLSKLDLTALAAKLHKKLQISNDTLYTSENLDAPKIGDLKITISVVLPQTVSVIAQQTEQTLQPYIAPAGQEVSILSMGAVSPQQMIQDALSVNSMMMWLLRFVSFLMMVFGIVLLMGPLVVLADVLPFLGSIVSFGTGLIAFLAGIVLWTLAIAIAWFAVRPLLAIILVVMVIMGSYGILTFKKSKKEIK